MEVWVPPWKLTASKAISHRRFSTPTFILCDPLAEVSQTPGRIMEMIPGRIVEMACFRTSSPVLCPVLYPQHSPAIGTQSSAVLQLCKLGPGTKWLAQSHAFREEIKPEVVFFFFSTRFLVLGLAGRSLFIEGLSWARGVFSHIPGLSPPAGSHTVSSPMAGQCLQSSPVSPGGQNRAPVTGQLAFRPQPVFKQGRARSSPPPPPTNFSNEDNTYHIT